MLYHKKYIATYSKFLINLAWTVEIIAVLIGFTISVVVAVSAYKSFATNGGVGLLDSTSAITVAGLPFVLIAAVEICKIPLTFAFMCVQNFFWRSLFLFFVLFLCLITFETMLNGFERNFSNLNRAIDTRKNEIENIESEIVLLNRRKDHIQKFTEDELLQEVEQSRNFINADYSKMVNQVNSNTRKILSSVDYSFEDELNDEIARLMDIRDGYYQNWSQEKETLEERFSVMLLGNISGSAEERERLLAELKTLKQEMDNALKTSNFFTRSAREAKYRKLIRDKEQQLATITTGYLGGDALQKQSLMEAQLKQQMEFVNTKYQGRVEDINERIEQAKQEIVARREENARLKSNVVSKAAKDKARFAVIKNESVSALEEYETNKKMELDAISTKVFGLDEREFELRNSQRTLQTEINHLINQNQIFRLAMYVFGQQSASDVNRGMVGIVGFVWFGSLALIASVTGVMLALAGFYLRRFVEVPDDHIHLSASSHPPE